MTQRRFAAQCEKILALLRLGPVTNREIAGIALKYTSRISDLRGAGHIVVAKPLGGGLVEYTLLDRDAVPA